MNCLHSFDESENVDLIDFTSDSVSLPLIWLCPFFLT